jgi:hypothetical protein
LTIAVFGLMVQNGYLSAGTDNPVSALNNVDFPALGSPTIPTFNINLRYPSTLRWSATKRHHPASPRAPYFPTLFSILST